MKDTEALALREQIARDFAPNVWPTLLERHRDRLRRRADALLALPALHRLVEQAAEAARLRAELQDFAGEMINHPDDSAADWGYDLAHRLGMLDVGEGTDG